MIVVTGGAGFIGSNIVAALAASAHGDVVVCDVLGRGDKWRNLAKHEIAAIVAPPALAGYLDDNVGSVEAVIHMGAVSATTERDADLVVAQNFTFSLGLWVWCARHQKRFIYASSAATYGDGAQGFDDDASIAALAELRPLNLYGWSKHLFDRRVARLVEVGGALPPQWAGLKFFNAYGPNEYHKGAMRSVVHQAYEAAAAGRPIRLFKSHHPDYADGGQLRDFVYIDDCVAVVLWLLDNAGVCGLFNVGTGRARSFADLAVAVGAARSVGVAVDYVDTPGDLRARYQYFTQARVERLRAAGFSTPFTPLEVGVEAYVCEYLSAADPYR